MSTAEQANNGDSLETQRQQITGYVMMKGWEVAEFFVDRGVSGSVPLIERPEGQRLLAAVTAGDLIITARLDRAFRSADDALATLKEFKEQGVGLHMIDLGGDVCGNGISKLVFTILSAVAENERDRIRERIRDVSATLPCRAFMGAVRNPLDATSWPGVSSQMSASNLLLPGCESAPGRCSVSRDQPHHCRGVSESDDTQAHS